MNKLQIYLQSNSHINEYLNNVLMALNWKQYFNNGLCPYYYQYVDADECCVRKKCIPYVTGEKDEKVEKYVDVVKLSLLPGLVTVSSK